MKAIDPLKILIVWPTCNFVPYVAGNKFAIVVDNYSPIKNNVLRKHNLILIMFKSKSTVHAPINYVHVVPRLFTS